MTSCCIPSLDSVLDSELFRALGDPTRLALVCRLAMADDALAVSDAATCCGVHLSGVSRHLAQLKRAGVVTAEKSGREVRYRLNGAVLANTLRRVADALESSACCAPDPTTTEPQGERA